MVSLYTAMNIALCVKQDPIYGNPIFDCKPDEAFETIKVLRDEIERLRRLGDTLAYHVRAEEAKEMYSAVHEWEEARRG